MDLIKAIENEQIRDDLPDFEVGDNIQVNVRVVEGNRERIQAFKGTVIKIQGSGARKTFTVRRVSYGVAVERTFPINSPRIDSIKVTKKGKVRQSRLYYLRDRVGKAARIKSK